MQRIKNDVLSSIQKINFNVVTDHFSQKNEKNKFHSTRILVKTTGKIDIHIDKTNGEKMCKYFLQVNILI